MPLKQKPAEWVTVEELAAEIKVSPQTVYTWNKQGKAPRRARFGKYVRYTRADVDQWMRDKFLKLDASGLDAGEQ